MMAPETLSEDQGNGEGTHPTPLICPSQDVSVPTPVLVQARLITLQHVNYQGYATALSRPGVLCHYYHTGQT
jgi:hypothetical protein